MKRPHDPAGAGSHGRDERREPSLGRVDDLAFRPRRPAAPRGGPADTAWRWWLGGAALLALALGLLRAPIAERLWPETRAQVLREQAAAALAAGRLTAGDGSGARELYEAALAIDPDRSDAHAGLGEVAEAALGQARTALAQERFADAHAHLRLARELSVPKAPADAVAEALRKREAAKAGLDGMVERAATARAAGRFEEDGDGDAALPLYARVLELQPDHAEALRGREDAIADVLAAAREALRTGDLGGAAKGIATARRYDAGHVDLPDASARLTEETDAVHRRADAHLRRGRLSQAAADYRALQALAGRDEAAREGLSAVAAAYAQRAGRLAADFEFAAAEAEIAQAGELDPASPAVTEARRHLERARQARARLAPRMPSPARERRVRELLAAAAAAEARGDLVTPPGESAYDRIASARALAPDSAQVLRAAARLLPSAQTCFERELRGNSLGRARACLDARASLGDDAGALAQSRRRLALRWLAIGDERLGAGELQAAGAALAAARRTDPAVPGIEDFDGRLRAASVSGN